MVLCAVGDFCSINVDWPLNLIEYISVYYWNLIQVGLFYTVDYFSICVNWYLYPIEALYCTYRYSQVVC